MSRRDGLAVALGMGMGGGVFGALALLGLHAVLARVPALYDALKVAGGLYLTYLAPHLTYLAPPLRRHAPEALDVPRATAAGPRGLARSLWLGLATQVSNPKTALVYGSVFAAFLPADQPL